MSTYVLDGDNIRHGLNKNLGYISLCTRLPRSLIRIWNLSS
ncbi:adenylyl-sulfate kinase [Lederbergia sp. NSJ-179]|nr:adenylyl-sulfate kinase [Lederbergia sp. NSJ-179]